MQLPFFSSPNREKQILTLFDAGLILKIFGSGLELLAGLATAFVPPSFVVKLAAFATQNELTNDPEDQVAQSINEAAHAFSLSNHFLIGAYLVLRGLVKISLVYGILTGKRVAYLLFMASLFLFGAYEAYRGTVRGESLLLILAFFDLTLLIITAHEYHRLPAVVKESDTSQQGDKSSV